VRELQDRGQARLTAGELIALRDRGVTSDRVRAFQHIVDMHVRAVLNGLVYLWPK
jgi:hypothetical protein